MVYRIILMLVFFWFGIYYIFSLYHLFNLSSQIRSLEEEIETYRTGYVIYKSRLRNMQDFLKSVR